MRKRLYGKLDESARVFYLSLSLLQFLAAGRAICIFCTRSRVKQSFPPPPGALPASAALSITQVRSDLDITNLEKHDKVCM